MQEKFPSKGKYFSGHWTFEWSISSCKGMLNTLLKNILKSKILVKLTVADIKSVCSVHSVGKNWWVPRQFLPLPLLFCLLYIFYYLSINRIILFRLLLLKLLLRSIHTALQHSSSSFSWGCNLLLAYASSKLITPSLTCWLSHCNQ